MNISYHIGHLTDHFNSNEKRGRIGFHLKAIVRKVNDGELKIDKSNEKIFRKIISRMMNYNDGYWTKENWEYKILYYALKGLTELDR
jgi:hypothetical protein